MLSFPGFLQPHCARIPNVYKQIIGLYAVADLEHFTWGGKGGARSLGRMAWVNGTWESLNVNGFYLNKNKTNFQHGSVMAQNSPTPPGAEPYVKHLGLNPNLGPRSC